MLKYYKNIWSLSLLFLVGCFFTSCKKDLPDVGGTAVQKMANEWYVKLTQGGVDIYGIGYVKIATYNLSSNAKDSMWIDDYGNLWPFKCKIGIDLSALTFSATNSANESESGESVTISEGKIMLNAATTTGGNKSDSIFMKIQFSDDPSNTYELAGYARTRFSEDDH